MDWAILGVGALGVLVGLVVGLPALLYSRRADRRVSSRADVGWHLYRTGPEQFTVLNTGRDTAHEVRVVLKVEDELSVKEEAEVQRGRLVEIHSSRAEVMHVRARDERQEYERERDRPKATFEMLSASFLIQPVHFPFTATAHITWRSAAGVWDQRIVDSRESPEYG
jgi:hypothetical protein